MSILKFNDTTCWELQIKKNLDITYYEKTTKIYEQDCLFELIIFLFKKTNNIERIKKPSSNFCRAFQAEHFDTNFF